MFQRMKKDFSSLFSSDGNHFQPIDGLRSLACLSIILVHTITVLQLFLPPYPHPEWINHTKSLAFSSLPLLGFELETFFVLSGFLLTNKFLQQANQLQTLSVFFKQYFVDIFRRLCRFWPGFLLIFLLMFILGEPNHNYLPVCLFYQNFVPMDQWPLGMGHLWSVSLDMQMHLLLPLLLYFIYSYRQTISMESSLWIFVLFSVLYSWWIFDPMTMDILRVISRYSPMALLFPENINQWIQSTYNFTLTLIHLEPNPVRLYMDRLYFPLLGRFGSFLIGSILAVKLKNLRPNSGTVTQKIMKYIYFCLVGLYFVLLISPSPAPKEEQTVADQLIVIIFICCARPVFAICQSFILFSALCPSTHPYHSSWMKKLLSAHFWSPIAKLSYLTYVLHMRLLFELIMNLKWFGFHRYAFGYSSIAHWLIVFIICLLIACVWHLLVERPLQQYIDRLTLKKSRHD